MPKKYVALLVAVIVLVTLAVRLYDLGKLSFTADEFLDMNGSYGYAQTGEWKAWDFNFGVSATQNVNDARDERAVVYKWQVAKVLEHLSPTEQHARLVSVFWGAISVLAIMFAAWFFTGNIFITLLSGALFAVSISSIIFDRKLRMYAMFYPLYLLASVFLFATLERAYSGKNRLLRAFQKYSKYHLGFGLLFVGFFVLSLLTHQLSGTLLFTALIYLVISLWKNRHWNVYSQSLALVAVGVLTLFILAQGLAKSFTKELTWFDDHYSYWGHFWADFQHPLLGLVAVCFGLWVLSKTRKKEALFLGLSAFVPLIFAIWFWNRNVGPQYIFFAQSFLLILAATGVWGLVEMFQKTLTETGRKYSVPVAAVLALLLLPHYSYFFLPENTYEQPSSGENTNYKKLFTSFNKGAEESDVLVTRNFRNYYFSGKKVTVYDFGGELAEGKLQKTELESLKTQYQKGWVVLGKNDFDYISKEAEDYLESEAFQKVDDSTVRGGNAVYRW